MESIKIIHCADVHLGMEFVGIKNKSRSRQAELKKTFLNIISMCKYESVDLLLIAGDLFDGAHTSSEDLEDIIREFAQIKDTRVFISPGNHDYLNTNSMYRICDWPENVFIFQGYMEEVEVPELGVRVYGAGFQTQYVNSGLLSGFKVKDHRMINIGVLHGDLVGRYGTSNYNPITEDEIEFSELDYLALGHIHKQTEILIKGNTRYAYSGSPEGHGFDEMGIKGVYLGTISQSQCNLKYYPTCKRRYEIVEVDISQGEYTAQISEQIKKELQFKFGEMYQENIYKIKLKGEMDSEVYFKLEDLYTYLEDFYYIRLYDDTTVEIDIENLAKNNSLKGVFTRKLLDAIEGEPEESEARDLYKKALIMGLKAFNGEVCQDEDSES